MKCHICGEKNPDQAKFCKACGAPLAENEQADSNQIKNKETNKPRNKRKWWVILASALLIVIFVSAVIALGNVKQEKQYEDYIASANRYIEQQDYDKAEDAYLKAIDIDPKKEEPYLRLADVYTSREEYEKAVQILKKAKTDQDKVNQKLDELVNMTEYAWVVKPEIEADNIYYLKNNDFSQVSVNEMNLQLDNEYAVIKNGASFGLIDMEGKRFEEEGYKSVSVESDSYVIEYFEEKYDEEMKAYTNLFFLIDRKLSFAMFYGGPPEGGGGAYYWTGSLRNTMEELWSASGSTFKNPSVPIPVRTSDSDYEVRADGNWIKWSDNLTGKYAIYYEGRLVSDFIYDKCGSYTDGVMAVCKDGKWGYVDKDGKIVIPFEYDASWQEYTSNRKTSNQEDYCYAAFGGYVPLVKDGKWEMRDTGGKVVIPSGIFEAIRPVHDSKCWVKKDGKWGVIELQKKGKNTGKDEDKNKEKAETITADTYVNIYGPILRDVNAAYASTNIYYFYDINKDGVKELLAEEGFCEGDYMYKIYTISSGESKYLGEVLGYHSGFYMDENGGTDDYIIRASGEQGYETISHIRIEGDKVIDEQISERQLGQNEDYYSRSHEQLPNAPVTYMSLLQSDTK